MREWRENEGRENGWVEVPTKSSPAEEDRLHQLVYVDGGTVSSYVWGDASYLVGDIKAKSVHKE